MTTPNKQKRYTSAFEIQAEIIAYKQKATRKLATAEKMEGEAWEKIKLANDPETPQHQIDFIMAQANELKEKAKRARRSYYLIYEDYIPPLVRTLGAFKTETMPFVDDKGITIQK